ncbi:hypothetical protein BCR39DRAFT_601523 [Naematelia encephala]|uniref:Uncharacterized protein n=1 Tax=Naematelia encephala TaxID=71784 RepID=A0A1Y2AD56_9TREE|nr:hypothetical protein BCR39DRAFT_601523 [Naematelia encephala]
MSSNIDYLSIATSILSAPTPPAAIRNRVVRTPVDFDSQPAEGDDEYQPGYYAPGTFVAHVESDREPDRGQYNVLLYRPEVNEPAWFCPPTFLLSTHGYHPQSAPLRPSYLIHAYRLALAVENSLAEPDKHVVAIYDCGEDSGVKIGHKCVRFYIAKGDRVKPRLPSKAYPLPPGLSLDTPAKELADLFQKILQDHVPQSPPYNLYLCRDQAIVVERVAGSDGKLAEYGPGLWDGGRLIGLSAE